MTRKFRSSVLSIPASHPYTRSVWPDDIDVLDDPTDPWWPHPALQPDYLRALAPTIDLVHLHFGYEHRSLAEIEQWCQVLADLGLPLLLTVHDIDHPHLVDSAPHVAHLDRLVDAAAIVTTLSRGAARRLETLFGRSARVIPHPPLVTQPLHVERVTRRVGLDLGVHRAGLLDPFCVLEAVGGAVDGLDATVEVCVPEACCPAYEHIIDDRGLADRMRCITDHHRLNDVAFAARVAGYDVIILPYRHATHSGRVELCRDVGTKVLATKCGHLDEQWPAITTVPLARFTDGRDPTLRLALGAVLDEARPPVPTMRDQAARLATVQGAHRSLLSELPLTGGRAA